MVAGGTPAMATAPIMVLDSFVAQTDTVNELRTTDLFTVRETCIEIDVI